MRQPFEGEGSARHGIAPPLILGGIGSGDTAEVGHFGAAEWRGGGFLCGGNAVELAIAEKARVGAGGFAIYASEPLRPIVR